jgi:adenine-specific DNA methylase
MQSRYGAWDDLRTKVLATNPDGVTLLDPFSGRGMIPLEAARLGLPAYGLDYSPVATLASELLTNHPFRSWDAEPELPFKQSNSGLYDNRPRLVQDVEATLNEVGRRYTVAMADFYPVVHEIKPWGYLWAVTLPCLECGRRFPLIGSLELKKAGKRKNKRPPDSVDPGLSLRISSDADGLGFIAEVHEGPPRMAPTLVSALDAQGKKLQGKSAVCIFCGHVHPTAQHRRMADDGLGEDALLAVVLEDRTMWSVTTTERLAAAAARQQLSTEPAFSNGLPAVPEEGIAPGNGSVIQPSIYGAKTFGDLMCHRQTLGFVRLSRIVDELYAELVSIVSADYARALAGYCAATIVRKLRYSTRGAWLRARDRGSVEVAGIFINESSIAFSYDFFETACYGGAGSWGSMANGTVTTLSALMPTRPGRPVQVARGSATSMPFPAAYADVVVTDPPYDQMIAYNDTSDLFFVWIRRALAQANPTMGITADPHGAQDKAEEIIVKKFRAKREGLTDHRTQTIL